MTQEDKAKAYDRAIERAKKFIEANPLVQSLNAWIKETFPELAESKDEKIRKAILNEITHLEKECVVEERKEVYRTWISWLEKQKATTFNKDIEKMRNAAIYACKYMVDNFENSTKQYEDAIAWLEKQGGQKPIAKMPVSDELYEHIRNICACIDDAISCYSVKDIQDYLAQARTDANIALDMVKQKPADTVELKCEESKTKVFDAPTPFEDKLYAFVLACEILVDPSKREFILEHSQEILDAAREQIGKEQSSTWSKEDERKIQDCIDSVSHVNLFKVYYQNELVEWLKSLRPQNITVTDEELAQAKKDAYNDALDKIEYHSGEPTFDDGWSAAIWYLKKRNAQPQNTWKPSDEQMADLWNMLCECRPADHQLLQDIYYGLKKLREE